MFIVNRNWNKSWIELRNCNEIETELGLRQKTLTKSENDNGKINVSWIYFKLIKRYFYFNTYKYDITLCSIDITLCSIDITLCSIDITLCSIDIKLCFIDITLCSIDITLCSINITLCSIDITLCSRHDGFINYNWWFY